MFKVKARQHSKFKTTMGYVGPCLKKKTNKKASVLVSFCYQLDPT